MASTDVFGLGGARLSLNGGRGVTPIGGTGNGGTLNLNIGQAAVDSAQDHIQSAMASLRNAFGALRTTTRSVYTTSLSAPAPIAIHLNGLAPRVGGSTGGTTLQTTFAINTQTMTDRWSAAPLGLDLSTGVSQLFSSGLGLDVTSSAPSTLQSSAGLGLDLTSPAAASLLQSAAAIGLDLSSPDAASILASASALGLDTSSPDAASQLLSAALGLDLTSPDAASVLSSSSTLGLDVTSAQSASVLSSSAGLALDVTSPQTASTITSTAEINTAPTSYDTPQLTWTGGGAAATSVATLSGTYTGVGAAASATKIQIKIKANATVVGGLLPGTVKFDVVDQANHVLTSFNGVVRPGDQIYLGDNIGLTVSFSAGTLTNNQIGTTNVTHTPTDVNGAAIFNDANPNLRPRFENGAQVGDGSFTINGATIAVSAGDSINAVLDKITASAAGVKASLTGDKITLTSKSVSEDAITFGSDSSGFLSAVKLAAATTTRGNVQDDLQVLAKTSQFGSVASGSFSINGVSISVDKNTDTLSSLVTKINNAGAGVTAAFDATQNKLVLTGTASSEDQIVVGADTSGFLTAAKLATANTVRGNIRDDQQVLAKTTQFAGVSSGSFTINGQSIAINTATDTLASIVGRINGANAGVTAAYNSTSDRLVLTATTNSETQIQVGDRGTGFLTAAKLATANTVRGHVAENTVAFADLTRFSSVGTGSFVVDGHSIAVGTGDTINSIVSKINSSGARVTAAFDTTANRLTLTTSYNTEDAVPIGSDTSGFLAAAGISAANTTRGNIADDRQVLAKTSQFGSVASGSFTINGVTIAVDKDADTLTSLVGRINGANAGVTASYNAASGKVVLTGTQNSEDLIAVGNDSSGFLAAAKLSTANTARGHLAEDGVVLSDTTAFRNVTNGSFVVDGQTIAVNAASDTVKTLVDKINQSGARVTASYDAAHDRLALQATYDSEDALAVGSDTSGFLAAAQIDAANTVRGNIRDDLQVLAKTSQFGSVTDGAFTINGTSIAVDAQHDTLSSLIDKINAAGSGVTASLNAASQRIELTGSDPSEDLLDIGNDSSGFLAAGKLNAANTVRGAVTDDTQVLAKTTQFGSVASGGFQINGQTIAVDVNHDSLTTIIGKINGAAAGVTASYDALADRLELTTTSDSEDAIDVSGDTTGFLTAAGLDGANTSRGKVRDDQQALAATARFSGVRSGSFDVNGVSIAVDAAHDSLNTLIQKINGAATGVTARYDQTSDTLFVVPDSAGGALNLENDTAGFFAAAGIATGAAATHVNADGAFNGSGLDTAFLDPGQSVHAGSFTLNGVAITVADNDTIRGVLQKITASAAGVNASYDDATQRVALTVKSGTSHIALAGDTSGFLAAVKLDGTAALTNLAPYDTELSGISEYSGVQAGTLTINGQSIAIDPSTMTLRAAVAALNQLSDVSASLDANSGRIQIQSRRASTPLSIADASHFLSAVGISDGSFTPVLSDPAVVQSKTSSTIVSNSAQVAALAATAIDDLNQALSQLQDAVGQSGVGDQIDTAIRGAVDELRKEGVGGLGVAGEGGATRLTLNRDQFAAGLTSGGARIGTTPAVDSFLGRLGDDLTVVARDGLQEASRQQAALGASASSNPASGAAPSPPSGFQIADQIRAQLSQVAVSRSRPPDGRPGLPTTAAAAYTSMRDLWRPSPATPMLDRLKQDLTASNLRASLSTPTRSSDPLRTSLSDWLDRLN